MAMSDLYAVVFDEEFKAAEAQVILWRLQKQGKIWIDDSAFVIKWADGKVTLHQETDLVNKRANQPRNAGLLAKVALGISRLTSKIDDTFIKEVGESLLPGGSALFAMGDRLQGLPGENAAALGHLHGKLVYTAVENVQEAAAVERALDPRPTA
jgi:uncharacterized membrane protein